MPARVHVRSLVDWDGRMVQRLVVVAAVDGAGLEAGQLPAAEPRGFVGHLLWSERLHHLLLTNRLSRVEEREPCLVGAGTDGARENNRARLALSLIMARPMGLRMFSSRRVPDLFLPNTAEFVAAAGSVSSIPPSMRLPEVAKTARYHSLVHDVTLFERWL